MSQTPLTLVCFAVRQEAVCFNGLAGRRADLKVLVTGMGRRNAERAIQKALAEASPNLVLSCGFAGGLKPELASGTVLFSTDGQASLESALRGAGAQPARFHCSDRVVSSAAEKRALREATGADAVEMESAILCAVCREQRIPCATVRVILDAARDDLPLDFNQLMNADDRIDNRELALALLRAPWKFPALLRFQKQARSAAKRLAEVLVRAVPL